MNDMKCDADWRIKGKETQAYIIGIRGRNKEGFKHFGIILKPETLKR